MTTIRIFSLLLFLCATWAPVRAAEVPRALAWPDLVVTLPPAENPFASLSAEQLDALSDIGAFRDRKAGGEKLLPQEVVIERAAVAMLEKMGIAIDALLARREEIAKKVKALEGVANASLDGRLVRLPGYLLPLEFTNKQVTEFLLVPWVGACIHTPPPPPNQIVHVKADKPYELKGAFEPVWVTGRITARATTKSVYISDGSADVDIGYSMQASQVQPYR